MEEIYEIPEISMSGNVKQFIYTVYSKDINGITLLNKAFNKKENAYNYAVIKILQLLDIIASEFKDNSPNRITPISATIIHVNFRMKNDIIEKYDYFKENYLEYFNSVKRSPILFFVSTLELL